jgi:hypothetical protein
MTLLQAWKNHPTRRHEFAALLNEPVMLDAIAIIKERCYEIIFPPVGGQYDLTQFYALFGAKQLGYLECLNNLLKLAASSPHKVPDRQPWVTVLDKAVEGQPKEEPETPPEK